MAIRSQPTVTHWTRFIPRALNVHRESGAGPMLSHLMLSHLMSAAQACAPTLVIKGCSRRQAPRQPLPGPLAGAHCHISAGLSLPHMDNRKASRNSLKDIEPSRSTSIACTSSLAFSALIGFCKHPRAELCAAAELFAQTVPWTRPRRTSETTDRAGTRKDRREGGRGGEVPAGAV